MIIEVFFRLAVVLLTRKEYNGGRLVASFLLLFSQKKTALLFGRAVLMKKRNRVTNFG
jgi:hypothetical protein